MSLGSLRFGSPIAGVLLLSCTAFAQPGSHKHVGTTLHMVGDKQVSLHHFAAKTNHQSHRDLQGTHRIGAAQGKNKVHFDLIADNGKFTVHANGKAKGIQNVRVATVKGQKGHHGRPHPDAGIASARLRGELDALADGTQFVSLEGAEPGDYSYTQFGGGGLVTITLLYQIGIDPFGNPIFASVTFQMSLLEFVLLTGL
jgi:hypothetical protein